MSDIDKITNLNIPPEYTVLSIPGTSISINYETDYYPTPYNDTEIEVHQGARFLPTFLNSGLFKEINTGFVDVLVLIKPHERAD